MATVVSAPLPELDWKELSIITVDSGNASAIVTELVIHLSQDIPEDVVKIPLLPPLYASKEAPGFGPGG